MSDHNDLHASVKSAVAEAVKQQVDAAVDIVSDGELGKIGYSTYVKDRLTGFDGEGSVSVRADWADFPDALARQVRSPSVARPSCNGPIAWKDKSAVQLDIDIMQAAVTKTAPQEAFMTAASPGVIAHFLQNQYYATRDEYLATLADVMKEEFEAITQAGFLLQLDCHYY